MANLQGIMTVQAKSQLTSDVFCLVLAGDCVKYITNPGQFINLKLRSGADPYLRRPMSICDYDDQTATIIFRVVGIGTKILAEAKIGDQFDCLIGLGNGFSLVAKKKALLIGGGLGTPPLYKLAKELIGKGVAVTIVLGFATKREVFYVEEFKELGTTYVVTVDGSMGIKGTVIDAIKQEQIQYDQYYSCGPEAMLLALAKEFPRDGQLSFEARMGCGFGACMGCSYPTKSGPKRVCVEGPIFTSEEVIVDD